MIKFNSRGGFEVEAEVELGEYNESGTVAVELWEDDGPYASLTVNLGKKALRDLLGKSENIAEYAFLDTNNFPEGVNVVENNNLGKFTGKVAFSWYCAYPLYHMNMDALRNA